MTASTEPSAIDPGRLPGFEITGEKYSAQTAAELADAERLCFSDPWSETSLAACLADDAVEVLVARRDGRILGYAMASHAADEADIVNLAVLPEERRRGIARALMLRLLDILRTAGVADVWLEVRASNSAAREMYASLGFTPAGERKNYYSSPREDGVIYHLLRL